MIKTLNNLRLRKMGKQNKKKIEEFESNEMRFKQSIANHSNKQKVESLSQQEIPAITEIEDVLLPFAINDPQNFKYTLKSSDRDKKVRLLAKFLFSKYKTPKILEQVWDGPVVQGRGTTKKKSSALRYRQWFVCAATGGSLYKEHLKNFLTKKEGALFVNCPFDLTIDQGVVYSIAFAEGNNAGTSLRIAKSKLNEKNYETEFWKNVIKFFAQEGKTPETIEKINDLVDFIQSQKMENAAFNIFGNGWTLSSLTKRMHDWHYDLRRTKKMGNFSWEGHDFKDFKFTKRKDEYNPEEWTITQIKTSKDLLDEGKQQHHCVFGYKNSCISGAASIWSLKVNGKRKVTIELRDNYCIVQARGFGNRKTTGEEDNFIRMWSNENNLTISYRY
jgi:hypothetical protein